MKAVTISRSTVRPFVTVFEDHRGNPAIRVGNHWINVILQKKLVNGAATVDNLVFASTETKTLLAEAEEVSLFCLVLSDGKVLGVDAGEVLVSDGMYLTVVPRNREFYIKGIKYKLL